MHVYMCVYICVHRNEIVKFEKKRRKIQYNEHNKKEKIAFKRALLNVFKTITFYQFTFQFVLSMRINISL